MNARIDPALGSQEENVLAFLLNGRELSPMDALRMFGIMRLGARIHGLRKKGHVILKRTERVGRKAWAVYRLA